MANRNGWPADSFDFNSAYLNSVLSDNKVIYLKQPPQNSLDQSRGGGGGHGVSWINPRKQVFWLHKALYGLKQEARSWYKLLKVALEQIGFKHTETDQGVFVKKWENEQIVVVAVHMDDCLMTGSSQGLVDEFKARINGKYRMMDLGPCKWLLGIKIPRRASWHHHAIPTHLH